MSRISEVVNRCVKKTHLLYKRGGFLLLLGEFTRRFILLFNPPPNELWAKLEMFLMLGYWPNLKEPKTFNEKICFRKLYVKEPLTKVVCDKFAVRDYVKEKTGREDILNELYWVGNDPWKIPFNSLPNKFVIKATHGSGWNIFVKDKTNIKQEEICCKLEKWLKSKYSIASTMIFERHYDDITPRIIIEKLIEDPSNDFPLDYKFFCFYGQPFCVQVDVGRFTNHTIIMFNINWQEMPFSYAYPKGNKKVEKPYDFQEMKLIAEQLSQPLEFCRVDFYNPVKGKIIFGEITLYPGSGLNRFNPREWDYRFGRLL